MVLLKCIESGSFCVDFLHDLQHWSHFLRSGARSTFLMEQGPPYILSLWLCAWLL